MTPRSAPKLDDPSRRTDPGPGAAVKAFILAGVIAAAALAGCAGGEPASTKYAQTWDKPYAETTCADWHQAMDEHERFVMAADMLLASHRRTKADAEIPSDVLVGRFETAIGGSCAGAGEDIGLKVSEVASLLYVTSNDLGPE